MLIVSEREKDSLHDKMRQGEEVRQRMLQFTYDEDALVLKKANLALEYQQSIARLRICHEDLLEAEIRHLEASSDYDGLKERNTGIAQRLEDERKIVDEATRLAKQYTTTAKEWLAKCQAIMAETEDNGEGEHFRNLDDNLTVEQLEQDIDIEKAKLEVLPEGQANAATEYKKRQIALDKLSVRLKDTGAELETIDSQITEIRSQWEPKLDELTREINDAFAYNFEQIGCAGEVGVHKDEEFEKWSIEIKVKFRYVLS